MHGIVTILVMTDHHGIVTILVITDHHGNRLFLLLMWYTLIKSELLIVDSTRKTRKVHVAGRLQARQIFQKYFVKFVVMQHLGRRWLTMWLEEKLQRSYLSRDRRERTKSFEVFDSK